MIRTFWLPILMWKSTKKRTSFWIIIWSVIEFNTPTYLELLHTCMRDDYLWLSKHLKILVCVGSHSHHLVDWNLTWIKVDGQASKREGLLIKRFDYKAPSFLRAKKKHSHLFKKQMHVISILITKTYIMHTHLCI